MGICGLKRAWYTGKEAGQGGAGVERPEEWGRGRERSLEEVPNCRFQSSSEMEVEVESRMELKA